MSLEGASQHVGAGSGVGEDDESTVAAIFSSGLQQGTEPGRGPGRHISIACHQLPEPEEQLHQQALHVKSLRHVDNQASPGVRDGGC